MSEKIFGYIPADEMQERMAGLKRQAEERKELEAKWKAEWEVRYRRELTEAAHKEATRVILSKPLKPLTIGQLRKWLSQWHRDTPVYYESASYDYDGYPERGQEPLTYHDVIKVKDGTWSIAKQKTQPFRIVIGD